MTIKTTNNSEFVNCYPFWLRFAGILIIIFGVVDWLQIYQRTFYPLSFLLAMSGATTTFVSIDKLRKSGTGWLTGGFLSWALLELLVTMFYFISSGMTQSFLIHISFRAPFWIVFGSWLAYYSHLTCKDDKQSAGKVGHCSSLNASMMFRLSILWLVFLLFVSIPPMIEFKPAPNQTMTILPFSAELMTQNANEYGTGRFGFPPVLQDNLEEVLSPVFSLPWIGFWMFPGLFILAPVAWYLSGKGSWKLLRAITLLITISIFSIPLQFALQYKLPIFGSTGLIGHGFILLMIPIILQIWSLFLASAGEAAIEKSIPASKTVAFPLRSAIVLTVIALIWTFMQPFLMRTNMEKLILAAQAGQADKFPICLQKLKSEIPDRAVEAAICAAIGEGAENLTEWLLTQNPDLNDTSRYSGHLPLWYALRGSGNFKITEDLLKAGADPNIKLSDGTYGDTAMGMVISLHLRTKNNLAYLRLLASYGADLNVPINHDHQFPIEAAICKRTDIAALQEMVRLGADPLKSSGANLFYLAASNYKPDFINFMLSAGLPADVTDKDGNTFLHLLILKSGQSDDFSIYPHMEPYIEKVINLKNEAGKTALSLAVDRNNPKMVEKLVSWGADDSIADFDGITPRNFAEKMHYLRLLKIMDNAPELKAKAMKNWKNK